ncbi:MAG: MFS transporter [Candidatus Abyssobacteria bacterium SURF_17]|uniref:MFS transporter n=1 Tax=Candidatus Abyssobacteria bacterium SURF_17 TaxID=2093361 RepID=A0A419EVS2_9BACT|nr:MAG: MFS transporter [Candidatus Abyssubacteria bacterium SURF_17]
MELQKQGTWNFFSGQVHMNESRIGKNWRVVAAGFLCMTIAAGIGWYVFPVYLTSIETDLGWTRTQMSLAVTVWALVGGAASPLVGMWIDKYGARKVMLLGTLCQIVATVLLARMTALWHLYAIFILAALANTANTSIPVTTVISQWFEDNRGTAMGVALLGMGLGGFLAPVLADAFLARYGWRPAYLIFSLLLVFLLVPIALWIRPKPALPETGADQSMRTETKGSDKTNPAAERFVYRSMSVAESARTRSFWTLGVGDFLISIVFTSVIVHMVAFTTDAGFSQSSAATSYGTFLAVNSLGILVFGAAADKMHIRWIMVFCYGAPALTMLFLFRLDSLWLLYAFALLFGVTGGGRSALWPLALGRCFGVAQLGSILGWLNIPFMIGNAVGPYLAGYIYDKAQSYRALFMLCMVCSVFAAIFISRARNERPPLPLREE